MIKRETWLWREEKRVEADDKSVAHRVTFLFDRNESIDTY